MAARGAMMEPLSPRDANALPKRSTDLKTKAAAHIKANKDKDHPPPPPAEVVEPPCYDRKNGAVYQVGKMLGKGGFAICYEGQQAENGKRFALKIVKSHMPTKMQQKFQTELSIHSKMRQANIVQFHRAFTFEKSTYLVLELCQNGSLMDMVKRRKGLTEPEVRFYTVQIAGAIKHMHARGIIHRDLKLGNIFLDKNMNAKVGDFGLAALLVTGKDMQVIRRTTICGTPNYIAPEILQKSKPGHDHAVDLWALGVIVFAMITTKPPFQSSTTDEIYRRAKEREYDWPRDVSTEVQLLVASMLEDPDRRPGPDLMLQDPFFTAGYVPVHADITPLLKEVQPDKACFYDITQTESAYQRDLKNFQTLCRECGVGPWANDTGAAPDLWREIAAEERHGLLPIIPLAADTVYRPYKDVKQELEERGLLIRSKSAPATATAPDTATDALVDQLTTSTARLNIGAKRAPAQSHAAQQRAQHRPTQPLPVARVQNTLNSAPTRPKNTRARVEVKELPLTTSGALSVEGHEQVTKTQPPRTQLLAERPRTLARSATSTSESALTLPQGQTKSAPAQSPSLSLFDPAERPDLVSGTRPDLVLEGLRKLQSELERALNSRSMAYISTKDKSPEPPRIIAKWVDYTNKFGLGYTLSDGSIGCLLMTMAQKDDEQVGVLPHACVLVRGAEQHIMKRDDASYAERLQILPMVGNVDFYEITESTGMSRVRVPVEEYRVRVRSDGSVEKFGPGSTTFEHRKRERIILWKKFGNYLMQHARPGEPMQAIRTVPSDAPSDTTGDVVTFYQRCGDVGVWVFCDGHVQINFPDHTKIVLDRTGTWCHFWHLPIDAAERLAREGSLDESSLDDRMLLSYPLQTLLNFTVTPKTTARAGTTRSASNPTRIRPEIPAELQGIPAANDFRGKIDFLRSIVKEWVSNGGIGNSDLSRGGRMRWSGVRQTKGVKQMEQKHVWTTVGARWGDDRQMAMIDLRKPTVLLSEVAETKRSA